VIRRAGVCQDGLDFALRPRAHGGVHANAETRVRCLDAASRRRFSVLDMVKSALGSLIRREMLRTIRRAVEQP